RHLPLRSFPTRRSSDLNLAWTRDDQLLHWTKHPGNPIIPGPPKGFQIVSGFRDPFVWRYQDRWYMIVGSGVMYQRSWYRQTKGRSEEHTAELQSRENLV